MNNYGFVLPELGFQPFLEALMHEVVAPLAKAREPGIFLFSP